MTVKLDLLISAEAAYCMLKAANYDKTLEVGGLAKVEVIGGDQFYLTEIVIPPQEVQSAHFDVTGEQFMDFLGGLQHEITTEDMAIAVEKGVSWKTYYPKRRVWDVYRAVWHSHAGMSTGPSKTDTDQVDDLVTSDEGIPWMLGLVTNVRGEYTGWVTMGHPVYHDAELDISIQRRGFPELDERVEEMMKQVTKKSLAHTHQPWHNGKRNGGYSGQLGGQRQLPVGSVVTPSNITDDDRDAAKKFAESIGLDEVDDDLVQMFAAQAAEHNDAAGNRCSAMHFSIRCVMQKDHEKPGKGATSPTHVGVSPSGKAVYFANHKKTGHYNENKKCNAVSPRLKLDCALVLGHDTDHCAKPKEGPWLSWKKTEPVSRKHGK